MPEHLTSTSANERYEAKHVHSVYESIAPHFSQTRYKPWPLVTQFLRSLAPGSVGLDVGCGNGKYLGVNREVYIIGSDRSNSLVSIAGAERKEDDGGGGSSEVIVGDALDLPHRIGRFDFAISIAVIHHLSTRERRVQAIRSIIGTLRLPVHGVGGGGKTLLYVWALEQKSSRRGWDDAHEQDVMVPWVMKQKAKEGGPLEGRTFNRYYHLYRKGELEENIQEAGGVVIESGYERDNWWAIAAPKPQG